MWLAVCLEPIGIVDKRMNLRLELPEMSVMTPATLRLPPLILHPFSTPDDTSVLVESSRANLILQGFLPPTNTPENELDQHLLRGRFAELRMLFYVGKDLTRWVEQCVEVAKAALDEQHHKLTAESFAAFLIEHIPSHVQSKLEGWGVVDYRSLFRRAIGLHCVFSEVPTPQVLAPEFLRRYHRHADRWFENRLRDNSYVPAEPNSLTFDLYASGEYAQMLEQTWRE